MVIFILYSIIYTIYSVKHIEPTPDCRGELLATRCRRQWRGLSPEPRKAGTQINLTGSEGPGTVKAVMPSKKVIKKAEQIKFSVQPIKLCFITVIFL